MPSTVSTSTPTAICLTDIAFTYVFSPVKDGRQTASVYLAKGAELRSPEPVGTKIVSDAEVSFGASAEHRQIG